MKTFLAALGLGAALIVAAAIALLIALLLVIGFGKGVRALTRRVSAHSAAAAASTEQLRVPVLLDLRRGRPVPHGCEKEGEGEWTSR